LNIVPVFDASWSPLFLIGFVDFQGSSAQISISFTKADTIALVLAKRTMLDAITLNEKNRN
jgi:hypothetical protein